ncbi:MAG TPA: hypothetical protein VHB27_24555, partial [Rhodopila sp.]|uniref:hypothetical protein n=1 Tax=Rhodopila sp. TaxID=2480087 RepID=UPI002C0D9ED6
MSFMLCILPLATGCASSGCIGFSTRRASLIAACVIDASVAIKRIFTAGGTEVANRLRWSGTAFHAP